MRERPTPPKQMRKDYTVPTYHYVLPNIYSEGGEGHFVFLATSCTKMSRASLILRSSRIVPTSRGQEGMG